MRKTGVVVLMLLFCSVSLGISACDVNLVAILSGANPDEEFGSKIRELAEQVRAVGQAIGDRPKVQERLSRLMKTWVAFDMRYSQTPPEWARQDTGWTPKIKEMASLVGEINREMEAKADEAKVHHLVIALTEKVTTLFAVLPLSREKTLLKDLFIDVAHLTEAVEVNQFPPFAGAVASLSNEVAEFRQVLASGAPPILGDFAFQITQLQQLVRASPGTITPLMTNYGNMIETSLKGINEKLAQIWK